MKKNIGKPLKVAAVGLGWVTTHRHLPTLRENPHYQLIGVIDSQARVQTIAQQYNCTHFQQTDTLENIPWLDEVDAITIGTPPKTHYPLIKTALQLGKHVLTEKPFAMTVAEGEELVTLAKTQGLTLGIVHNFQFASSTQRLLHDIKSGCFGKIKAIVAQQLSNPRRRLPAWYEQLPLGLFYDESPHFFYLVSKIAPGSLKLLQSDIFPSTLKQVTPAAINLQYQCDSTEFGTLPVSINMNFEAPISEWHLTVYGENYLGDIDIFRDIYIRLPNDGLHTTRTVIRTSALATWQHWSQHFTSGIKHLRGTLRYGNDVVFSRFAEAAITGCELEDIDAINALSVLKMQHEAIGFHR
ncbi:Gfo/Idh/MocA family protein [Lusitaniella coriacea]|uniref:Gfo/Idh/MocA family protein n=1 Tax=Lusitaniella coriacea TaxID=1983105 RepID=UPI001D1565B4|nr:Gfo/Idh/MocA family oxidoreductase [Lusitaniella coriacea]